jgi:hypothetical protein
MAPTDGGEDNEGDGDNDDMSDLRASVEQLKAEMAWVKAMLLGQRPSDVPAKTSPPWVTIITFVVGPALAAFIATAPWK